MFTKEIMDTFSELDFAVYDCIINNRERVSSMTIKELGNLAHVSTATVLRFAKKVVSTVIVSSKSSTRSIWKEKGTL